MKILLAIFCTCTIVVQAQTQQNDSLKIPIDTSLYFTDFSNPILKVNQPLYIVNRRALSKDSQSPTPSNEVIPYPTSSLSSIKPELIESIEILRGENAIKAYGEKGKNGVVIINLKPIRGIKE